MATATGGRVTVAGAGALGLCIALELARQGREVVICDPAPLGANASGVAAGMLAPAFESALDPSSFGHFELLRTARDLWPEFAAVDLDRSGAIYRGGRHDDAVARLVEAGATWSADAAGLFSPEDWRLTPGPTLAALRRQALAAGARFEARQIVATDDGLLVLATGPAAGHLAPELDWLQPIKGHILRLSGGPASGPVIRGDGVYLCPAPAGAILGATMELGREDTVIEPEQVAALRKALPSTIWPDITPMSAVPSVGVRAATPDGLPLVGWSAAPGVLLATGARRNGWLLAPLVARTVAAYVADQDPGPFAARLDPRRFDKTSEDA